jgi:amino acid adenylation domain-containing protein
MYDASQQDLVVIGYDETDLVARKSNQTDHPLPGDYCLPDLLLHQAQAQPDSVAVVFQNTSLTYRQLVESGIELAAHLHHLGVAPDDCVGIFVEPSLELTVGIWGILFAGGAYLPLSPEYPTERLRYMIKDSGAKIILCQEQLKPRLEQLRPQDTRIVTLREATQLARSPGTTVERAPATGLRSHNLAYIIYTSGSTGRPKGVMIEHRSIVNQLYWLKTVQGLGRQTTILQKTPLSFDAAQWEILAPACGSKVVMGSPGVYRDPVGLIDAITRHGVTTLQCVPTLLRALLDTEKLSSCTSLTQIFSGGEALARTLALDCLQALPNCELVNLYGPSECTINSSAFTVSRDTLDEGPHTVCIGTPVHNTRYYILDRHRSPVGVGEIGELYISGVQLARGYLRRPDLTADRFIDNPFPADHRHARLYRTGDLAYWNADGTVQFAGRTDNQVKLRGFRVELDEIKLSIETHDWVKNAAVIVKEDHNTGFQNLIAFIELNPKEAALMDQGNHGAHHQSKESKLQIRAQLANLGCRDVGEISGKAVLDIPGKVPTRHQRRQVFARKTYRFFEGGDVTAADIVRLLGRRARSTGSRSVDMLTLAEFGEILRYFGQYTSEQRLLPKYGYASPGALYATQMYFEINGVADLAPGYYYYHPVHHQLILIRVRAASPAAQLRIHFIGKKRAIEPVYKNNIQEVLEIETGHMVGQFEEILPAYGLDIRDVGFTPTAKDNLETADEDYYLGTFELVPYGTPRPQDSLEVYVQSHPGRVADLPAGQYQYQDGGLEKISEELILKKHVIAINQEVYARASFGITLISRTSQQWMRYIDLGRKLHQLQANDLNLGLMSSGYSSQTGNDLPSARRMNSILTACGKQSGPSYFFVGGRVSDEQVRSEGMTEDVVHMKGPTEMIKEDLVNFLPDYMIPNRVVVLDRLPLTANGKIDAKALEASDQAKVDHVDRLVVAPRTNTEARISAIWKQDMKRDVVSILDDFFESGGNSLIAVGLINKLNKEFHSSLPMQVLFECPTIEMLARRIDGENAEPSSRLVRLRADGTQSPVYSWPGLGGYAMNLRQLAGRLDIDRPFYGVQAHGINADEIPYATIKEMAAADVTMIRRFQPNGPYTLWGYSFGARVAFEAAYQLENSGEQIENLFLIAPGSPKVRAEHADAHHGGAAYDNKAYVTILFSVFTGSIADPLLDECLRVTRDEESFTSFICERFENMDTGQVTRIARIVYRTYNFNYTFQELAERTISAPITIFKAQGDDYSFIENSSGHWSAPPTVIDLGADHYSMLRDPDVDELAEAIRRRLRRLTGQEGGHRAACQHQTLPRAARREAAGRTGRRPERHGAQCFRLRRRDKRETRSDDTQQAP